MCGPRWTPITKRGARLDPKAPLAIDLWRNNAKAIDAYLLDRGLDIGDWHRGTLNEHGTPKLSSRRLIALCEHIPELGGRWPIALKVASETHREVALHRNALYAGGENAYLVPGYLCPPDEVRAIPDPELLRELIAEEIEAPQRVSAALDRFYQDHGLIAVDAEGDSGGY